MDKEKKEIGMEKLIRYLLESKGEEYKGEYYEWYRDVELEQNIDSLSELKPFIKWLVENDKIDKKKIDTRLVRNVESHYDEDGYWVENSYEDYSNADTLLMLLSISSSPIEDLVLYLK